MRRTFTRAESLVHTSADDCKITLRHYSQSDMPHLEQALQLAEQLGYKTKAAHIGRRIRAIKRMTS